MQMSWSTPMNQTSGLALAAFVTSGTALNPLTTMMLLPSSINDWSPAGSSLTSFGTMYGGSGAPMAVAPSRAPAYEYWLKFLSSIEPTSVWTPTLKAPAAGDPAAGLSDVGASDAGATDVGGSEGAVVAVPPPLQAETTMANPVNRVRPSERVRMFPPPASWSRVARPSRRARRHDGSISARSCGPTLARILPALTRPGQVISRAPAVARVEHRRSAGRTVQRPARRSSRSRSSEIPKW